jgi:hypothetical protein
VDAVFVSVSQHPECAIAEGKYLTERLPIASSEFLGTSYSNRVQYHAWKETSMSGAAKNLRLYK